MVRLRQGARSGRGFTLIELIVVIVILGVLAATALSKFVDLRLDARKVALSALAGQIKSTVGQARAACILATKTCDIQSCYNCMRPDGSGYGMYATIAGKKISFLRGWPTPFDYSGNSALDGLLTLGGFTVVKSLNDPLVFKLDAATDPDNCKVTYELLWGYSDSPPPVTIVDTGC